MKLNPIELEKAKVAFFRYTNVPPMEYQPAGCLEWNGYISKYGYGILSIGSHGDKKYHYKKSSPILAHRFSYFINRGHISDNLCVLHHCDNRKCVNPLHLFLGTKRQNSSDMVMKDRQAKGERNGCSKLNKESVLEIRKLGADGVSSREIAKRFGVSKSEVCYIIKRTWWNHV